MCCDNYHATAMQCALALLTLVRSVPSKICERRPDQQTPKAAVDRPPPSALTTSHLTAREVSNRGGSWQHSSAHTPQLLTSRLLLLQSLTPQTATQEGLPPLKKRRKNQSSQQGHADARTTPTDTDTTPLTDSWQAACSHIQVFLAGLAPLDSSAMDDTGRHAQLQALLHTVLAARKVQSAGLTAASCAVAGKWIKHVLQQQQQGEQSGGPHACFDLIGKCTSCHAFAMQPHSMPCTLCRFVMRPVPELHRCL